MILRRPHEEAALTRGGHCGELEKNLCRIYQVKAAVFALQRFHGLLFCNTLQWNTQAEFNSSKYSVLGSVTQCYAVLQSVTPDNVGSW